MKFIKMIAYKRKCIRALTFLKIPKNVITFDSTKNNLLSKALPAFRRDQVNLLVYGLNRPYFEQNKKMIFYDNNIDKNNYINKICINGNKF